MQVDLKTDVLCTLAAEVNVSASVCHVTVNYMSCDILYVT